MAFEELKQMQARAWGSAPYEAVSAQHLAAVQRLLDLLDVQPGELLLDVATGSGELARPAAALGARVTAVDLAPELVEATRRRALEDGVVLDAQVGDGEHLPHEDASFDVVTSTFGAMFCPDHGAVAAELARVCRSGGRLGLASWISDGGLAEVFATLAAYQPAPPAGVGRPFDWGEADYVRGLLGRDFALTFHALDVPQVGASGEEMWRLLSTAYGPIRALAGSLDQQRRRSLHDDMVAAFERYRANGSIQLTRRCLLALGTRR